MILLYLGLSLAIGVLCGATLAYLRRSQKSSVPVARQWLVYAASTSAVLAFAAGIGAINRTSLPAENWKFASAGLVALGFFVSLFARTLRK